MPPLGYTVGFAQASASSSVGSLQDSTNFSPSLVIGSPNTSISSTGTTDQTSKQAATASATATPLGSAYNSGGAASLGTSGLVGAVTGGSDTSLFLLLGAGVLLLVILKKKKVL